MLLNRGCKQRDALNAILAQMPSEPEQMNIQGQGQGMNYQQRNIQQYQQYQNKMRQSNKKETDNKSIQTSSSSSHSNSNPNIPQIPPPIQENRFVNKFEVVGYREIVGRVCIALWRQIRSQQIKSNTLYEASKQILGERIPAIPGNIVGQMWWEGQRYEDKENNYQYIDDEDEQEEQDQDGYLYSNIHRLSPSQHFIVGHAVRVTELIQRLSTHKRLIGSTSEFARMIGIPFLTVLSRGSQFRVESFLTRLAKQRNVLLISPSRQQVLRQPMPECPPLVLEPLSGLRKGPVSVLDFQSLYPSIIIAYNYCYCTCLGRAFEGVVEEEEEDYEQEQINVNNGSDIMN
ncbi:MAG: putative DNA polymerase zeta catalytic subunit, partial [Streblomastix strix]